MRHLHLIIPPPADGLDDSSAWPPELTRFLSRGRTEPAAATVSEACCEALGLSRQQDWPVAPYTARAAGLEVGDAYWLRLDPVHLDVGLHGLFLRGGLVLDGDEIRGLEAVVAPIASATGLETRVGEDGVLYLRCPTRPRLATTPLDRVEGRQPTRFLPTGEDAPAWTRLLHEIQMVLHGHPLNEARAGAGKLPVNSFWPWGGGQFVPPVQRPSRVWGNAPMIRQMAHSLDIPVHPAPPGAEGMAGVEGTNGVVLLAWDFIDTGGHKGLETHWLKPLRNALRLGRLASLRLSLPGDDPTSRRLTPLDAWRLWG